jgi:hypothetical protein
MALTVRARQRWGRLFEHTWVHSHQRRGLGWLMRDRKPYKVLHLKLDRNRKY